MTSRVRIDVSIKAEIHQNADLTSYSEPVHVIQKVNGRENQYSEVLVKRLSCHQTHI